MNGSAADKAKLAAGALAALALAYYAGKGSAGQAFQPETLLSAGTVPTSAATNTPVQDSVGGDVTVHVVGVVKKPGLYSLPAGSRIRDAIEKAGGAGANADLDALNLARKLEDGVQLRVPKKGEQPSPAVEPAASETPEGAFGLVSPPKATAPRSSSSSGRPAPRSISLNTATASQLDRLPGVGPSTAAKILEYRRAHGGFASIDELLAVKGIGPKKLKDMRPYLKL